MEELSTLIEGTDSLIVHINRKHRSNGCFLQKMTVAVLVWLWQGRDSPPAFLEWLCYRHAPLH